MEVTKKVISSIIKEIIKVKETSSTTCMEFECVGTTMVKIMMTMLEVVSTMMVLVLMLVLVLPEGIVKVLEKVIKVEVGLEILALLSLLTIIPIHVVLLSLFFV
nr:hypothetical protein BaRGS_031853 [Batillaria attramentaria]